MDGEEAFLCGQNRIGGEHCCGIDWLLVSIDCPPKEVKAAGVRRLSGISLRNCVEWNKVVTYKHLLAIQGKQESLWVKWVHSRFMKNEPSIWTSKVKDGMAWSVKKIIKLKNSVASIFDIRLGDGRGTLFWHDLWFESRPLIDREEFRGRRIRRDCATATADVHLWNAEEYGKLKSNKIWNVIRERGQVVNWADLVWSSKVIPRYRFILWLTFRRRLNTRDRIQAYIDIPDVSCLHCDGNVEMIDHLLGGCPFTRHVWNKFTSAMSILSFPESWEEIIATAQDRTKANKFPANAFKCSFASIVYHVWAERNARVFGRVRRSVDQVWSDIVFHCGALMRTWRRIPKGEHEWNFCRDCKISYEEVTSFKKFKVR
ncbi:uncharacterized protein LOC124913383 [Impatiens glandulifera]|uniref:uncharacterized protein LOC124913383 n=1 Tax=Impatiens glandulifera TaxID=253017 RepID=UPI001FB183E7|nr:uncharacterized protein LOC124913383 [Impatiens glandulifera]